MKSVLGLLAALALLLLPSAALAQGSPTCQSYNPQDCKVISNVSASQTLSSPGANSTLPFTGLDVVLLAAGGGTLLGAGLVVRRLSRGVQ